MQKNIKTLTNQECALLLNQLFAMGSPEEHTPRRIRNYTIALLMLDAGLRVGEVCALQIRDLVYNGEPVLAVTIRAEISKTKAERTIPLSARLQDAIRRMVSKLPNGGVLPGQRPMFYRGVLFCDNSEGENINYAPLTTRQVQRIIADASFTAFGRRIHPHCLRHTFGTKLMRTVNASVVQALLGHKRLSSTQVYCHPDAEDLKNAIDGIA